MTLLIYTGGFDFVIVNYNIKDNSNRPCPRHIIFRNIYYEQVGNSNQYIRIYAAEIQDEDVNKLLTAKINNITVVNII